MYCNCIGLATATKEWIEVFEQKEPFVAMDIMVALSLGNNIIVCTLQCTTYSKYSFYIFAWVDLSNM